MTKKCSMQKKKESLEVKAPAKCSMQKKKESLAKKSEGAIGDTIKMNIDYNTFMRLLDSAAYLSGDAEYHDALWDYYSDFGEMSTKADEFFDNLFQYTDWCDVDEMYDEHISDDYKDDSKSREECVVAAIEAGDVDARKYGDHYLVLN